MSGRPALFTRGLSSLSQTSDPNDPHGVSSPAEQRDDAKRNFLKAMRPLPTQHVWNVYFDRYAGQSCFLRPLQVTYQLTVRSSFVTGKPKTKRSLTTLP